MASVWPFSLARLPSPLCPERGTKVWFVTPILYINSYCSFKKLTKLQQNDQDMWRQCQKNMLIVDRNAGKRSRYVNIMLIIM